MKGAPFRRQPKLWRSAGGGKKSRGRWRICQPEVSLDPVTPCLSAALHESPGPAEAADGGHIRDSAKAGDDAKPVEGFDFSSLYQSTINHLRYYLERLLGNAAEAQDVAHDAFVRVYPVMTEDRARQPRALLYLTARRLAINRLKRRRISPVSEESAPVEFAASSAPGVVRQVMARQELGLLEEAIASLPENCRAVLLLRKVELLSHQEIAGRLGLSVSTVEKHHARALRLIRSALPEQAAALRFPRERQRGKVNP